MKRTAIIFFALTLTSASACRPGEEAPDMAKTTPPVYFLDMSEDPDMPTPASDMSATPGSDMDMTPDANPDMASERDMLDMSATPVWEATFQEDRFDLTVGEPLQIDAVVSMAEGVSLTGSWSLGSSTAEGIDCSSLLQVSEDTPTRAVILLPGNTDARCADELELEVILSDGASSQQLTASIEVIPIPGRATSFVPWGQNPQPDIQTCPAWECLNHSDPTLGILPTGELAVWFAAGGDRAEGKPVVGRAIRAMDGSWTLDADPVMTPADATAMSWDINRETPSVRWNAAENAWDMWYLGYNVSYHQDPAIGQTRSLDPEGTQWSRPASPAYRPAPGQWDESFLTSPGALLGSDGIWRLYYAGASVNQNGARASIGVLTSEDGVNWTPHQDNPVFVGKPGAWDYNLLDPHVQFIGGRYVMWYSALAGQFSEGVPISVGVAVSEDGYTWERLLDEPILSPEAGTWRSQSVLDVEVLEREDGSLIMVGYGRPLEPPIPAYPDFKPGRIGLWISE